MQTERSENSPMDWGDGTPAPAASGPPPPGYKFSPDELQVMAECNRESFYKRCLPFSSLFGLGAYSLVQAGYLRGNPRFGAMPKVTLAVVVGYFLGKLSYQKACAEKLMALPGSYIGQLLRERRDGVAGASSRGVGRAAGSASMFGAGPGDIYSDAGPGSALDLNTDRPAFDDAHPPPSAPPPAGPAPPPNSYDELRRRNRTDLQKPIDPYREEPSSIPPIRRAPPPATGGGPPRRTNIYGDEMD